MPSDDPPQAPVIDPEDRPLASRPRGRVRRSLLARLLPVMIVVVALGGFAGLVGYYYMADGPNGAAPLIKADLQPFKIKPDNPGGMDVPDQDKAIYDRMGRVDQSSVPPPNTERLLPPPETPVPRPAAAVTPPAAPVAPNPVAGAPNPPPPGPGAPAPTPSSNPNVGGPVLGMPQSPRTTTLATVPPGGPAPAASPPPPAAAPPKSAPAAPASAPAAKPAPTKTAAVAPRPEAAPPASGGPLLRAAIASLRTEADARREWERQRRLYPEALAGVTPSYASVDLGGKGVYWRIYIGPAESSAEARGRCEKLKEKKVECFVARP